MTTALLVMDAQVGVAGRLGADPPVLDRLAAALDAARAAGLPVIFVRVAFRPGYPEVAASNRAFSALASTGGLQESAPETQIHPRVAPRPDEPVVVKKRISAFAGSDLRQVLNGGGVDTLVLTGIATSGVVLSTLRYAADLDYRLVVLADACADADDEVHRMLTTKVFPRQAEVLTVAQWAKSLGA
jgi:nicotinamidase-related amidase